MNATPALSAPLPPQRKRSRHPWSRLLDRLSIYLPVLLMALLALGSYWLLRATPPAQEAAPAPAVTHEPDYYMRRFSVKAFDAVGVLKSEVFGAEARHRPDTGEVEIDNARIRAFDAQGQLTTATAQSMVSNADQTEFVLTGNAVVVREGMRLADGAESPRLEFRGEMLTVTAQPQRIWSDRPVTLIRGQDQLSGDSLDYQGSEQVALLKGRVKARLVAR